MVCYQNQMFARALKKANISRTLRTLAEQYKIISEHYAEARRDSFNWHPLSPRLYFNKVKVFCFNLIEKHFYKLLSYYVLSAMGLWVNYQNFIN